MKKALFFAASFCLFLAGLHSTAWAAQDIFSVKLNVPRSNTPMSTLVFSAETDKYGRLQELTTKFGDEVYHITYQQLRSRDEIAIKYSGTQLLTVQGFNTNQQGEGFVRLAIEQMFVGAGVVPYMDLELRQVGAAKKWLTLVNKKAATGANMMLSLDPSKESMISMLMSPPKVVKSAVTYTGCTAEAIAEGTKTYGADFAKASGCQATAATAKK